MKRIIPYGGQYIDRKDINAVTNALKQNKITTGPLVKKFEKAICSYTKSNYAISCNSGTSALFLAFKSINLKKDDIVIMPSITFISSYSIAKIFHAKVYLADVDSLTGQMTPKNVIDCCRKFKLKKIKLLVVMYNGGYPINADKFVKIKNKLGCAIIEDSCHAFGGEYNVNKKKYKVGSCKHADISTFSFHPLKSITTCEGGAITTNNKKIYDKLETLRSIGIKRSNYHWKYDVEDLSLNFRLSDVQCALGISQLKKLNKFIKKREKLSKFYDKNFKKINEVNFVKHKKNYKSSYHLYFLKFTNFNQSKKDQFFKFMKKRKILLQYHYIPVFKFNIFNDKYIGKNSIDFYNNTISLPIYFSLTKKNQHYIINSIKNFFNS